ncbi:MAG: glycosyltransferase family 2 protein [Dehalococcoidia bacterium]
MVIPALNEIQSIKTVVASIPKDTLHALGYEVEIIVVDNGSADGTGDAACEAGATVVVEPRPGYGCAYKAGYAQARGEILISLDADLTYPSEVIPELARKMDQEGYDFITTNRMAELAKESMGLRSRLGNKFLSFASARLCGIPLQDFQSGMWLIRRTLLDQLHLASDGMPFSNELKIQAVQRARHWLEVPIEYRPRVGPSKLRAWRDGWATLFTLLRLRWTRQPSTDLRPERPVSKVATREH